MDLTSPRHLLLFLVIHMAALDAHAASRPNILWITSEDNGPQLGCYGDAYATSPHIDSLARRGLTYVHAWSNAPVCAPARTTIISGRHPTGDGSEHMRSEVPLPQGCLMFPQYLRNAGYYCTNNSKEDYNYKKPDGVWDESSGRAHYRHRGAGQPFFAVFNLTTSHESQIRKPGHTLVHDPARVPVPPYHPDTPEVRHDWAQYYDKISEMDQEVGRRLKELEDAGLAEDTIIFYFGDHGAGMPRSKRWPYNSGLRVPLILHIPAKFASLAPKDYAAGAQSTRPVSFVDLAPTVISLAGEKPPGTFQGRAFAGHHIEPAPGFLYGYRGRMDERMDLVRSVTDGRHVYLRHYMPHLPYAQHIAYMFEMPTAQVWRQLAQEGRLNEVQSRFWSPKPVEELYDLVVDPWETQNLAESVDHQEILARLRAAHEQHLTEVRDLGFIPEAERLRIAAGRSPRDAFATDEACPVSEVHALARLASDYRDTRVAPLVQALAHRDATMRFWGILGLHIRHDTGVAAAHDPLVQLLEDPSPSVRIAAASALGQYGRPEDLPRCLEVLAATASPVEWGFATSLEALNALDALGSKALPVKSHIADLPRPEGQAPRLREYVPRLQKHLLEKLP